MKVHALMTVYYKSQELLRCLNSLDNMNSDAIVGRHCWINGADTPTKSVLELFALSWHYYECGRNIGKAAAINRMVKQVNFPIDDLIWIIDPDLVFQPDTLEQMLRVHATYFQPVIVVPEHTGARAHIDHRMKYSQRFGSNIVSVTGEGVAGAAMLLSVRLFKNLGGFAENSIYGGNEASLWQKLRQKYSPKVGRIVIAGDARVEHLAETDKEYRKWKCKCQEEIRATGQCTQGEYRGFGGQQGAV